MLQLRAPSCRAQGAPSRSQPVLYRRASVVVRAEGESTPSTAATTPSTPATATAPTAEDQKAKNSFLFRPLKPVQWTKDTETFKDVFGFAGSAPERVNGRVAMLGFASVAAAELSSKTPALEQAGDAWLSIVFVSALFSIASIMPKFISGTSLKELHAAATSDALKGEGLQAALALFDTNIELWAGRLAMIGFVGLAITEKVIGDAFFG